MQSVECYIFMYPSTYVSLDVVHYTLKITHLLNYLLQAPHNNNTTNVIYYAHGDGLDVYEC